MVQGVAGRSGASLCLGPGVGHGGPAQSGLAVQALRGIRVCRHKRPSGPLFRRSPQVEEPIRIAQLDELLHSYLEGLQVDTLGLIGPQLEVAREYSFRRSIRLGSTRHARNQGTASDVIEANNRWRKLERAGHREAGLSMLDMYTDEQAALDLNLRYSESL
jgi:hypothetical protein